MIVITGIKHKWENFILLGYNTNWVAFLGLHHTLSPPRCRMLASVITYEMGITIVLISKGRYKNQIKSCKLRA